MRRRKPQRIVGHEELLRSNPTQAQLDSYWPLLRQLQAWGMVDQDLNVVARGQRSVLGPVRAREGT